MYLSAWEKKQTGQVSLWHLLFGVLLTLGKLQNFSLFSLLNLLSLTAQALVVSNLKINTVWVYILHCLWLSYGVLLFTHPQYPRAAAVPQSQHPSSAPSRQSPPRWWPGSGGRSSGGHNVWWCWFCPLPGPRSPAACRGAPSGCASASFLWLRLLPANWLHALPEESCQPKGERGSEELGREGEKVGGGSFPLYGSRITTFSRQRCWEMK